MKYEVKDVVCDYGVFENDKLCLICNSRRNALQIVDIMRSDTEHKILVLQPVVHGHWIKQYTDGFYNGERNYKMICPHCDFSYLDNHCGMIVPEHFNYCPNCGAKMDGENE